MIALRSDAACGYCPLSLTCLRGKPIIWDERRVVAPLRYTVQPNVLNVVMCKRCAAVFFTHGTKRFICERLRDGHHPLSIGQAKSPTAQVRAAMGGHHPKYIADGCAKYFLREGGDCFEMLAKDIDVTY